MMVGFLNEFADAEQAVGNVTGATALREEAAAMSAAMAKYMWCVVRQSIRGCRARLSLWRC